MGPVLTLVRSELRSGWRGWLVSALLVAVGGGVGLTAAAGARRTDTAYARFLSSSHGADAEIAPSSPGGQQNPRAEPSYFAAVTKLPGVAVVAPTVAVSAVATEYGNAAVLLGGGTDARLGGDTERPKITDGRMFNPAQADEAVAEPFVANQLHLHVGSVLHLLAGAVDSSGFDFAHATPLTLRIVGLGVSRNDVVPVTAFASGGRVLVTPALFNTLNPDTFSADAAFIGLRKGASFAAFQQRARALLTEYPDAGTQLFVVDEHQQAAKVEHAIHPQAVALALFALLVALSVLLTVGQIVVRQVFVAAADHPALRSLGMTRTQLMAIGMVEVAFTIAVGAAMAVLLAIALSPLMPIGPARLAEPHPGLAANWAIIGLGVLTVTVVFALRVAPALWQLAIQPAGPDGAAPTNRGRTSRIAEAFTRRGVPVSALVGARLALEPGRGRRAVPIRSTLAGTAVAVAAVAAAFTFGTNLVRLANTPRLYGQSWQVSLDAEFGTMTQGDAEMLLRQQHGVSEWTFGNHAVATIAGHDIAAVVITGAKGPAMFPTVLEGRTPQSRDEIVVGTKTLAGIHRHVGQTVSVKLQSEDTPRTVTVVGRAVFPFFGQGEVTPTGLGEGAALLDPGPHPNGYNFILIGTTHGSGEHDAIAGVTGSPDASNLCTCSPVTDQRPADVSNYARIRSTPLVLAGVLALLAVATVAHLLVTSIRRRHRDLAVLKTLGFVRRQVSAAVAWQATIIAALALMVGLPLGVGVGRWAWLFFAARLGAQAVVEVPMLAVLFSIPAALAIVNAVAAVPGWSAGRLRPALVLRSE